MSRPTAAAVLAALPAEQQALIWCRAGVAAGDAERPPRPARAWPDLPPRGPRAALARPVTARGATPTAPPPSEDV